MRKRNQVIESSEAVPTMTEPLRPDPRQSDVEIDVDDLPVPSNGVPILKVGAREPTLRARRSSRRVMPAGRALRERVLDRQRRWRR